MVNQSATLNVIGYISSLLVYSSVTINGSGVINSVSGTHTALISGNNPYIYNGNEYSRAVNEFNAEKNRVNSLYPVGNRYLYTESSWNTLQSALGLDVNNKQAWQVQNAKNAITSAANSMVSVDQTARTNLGNKINEAISVLNDANANSNQYPEGAISTFDGEISKAQTVYDNPNSDTNALNNALSVLTNAITTLKDLKISQIPQ